MIPPQNVIFQIQFKPQHGRGPIYYPEMRMIQKDHNFILFLNPSLHTYSKPCCANRNHTSHVYRRQYHGTVDLATGFLVLSHTGSMSYNRLSDNI